MDKNQGYGSERAGVDGLSVLVEGVDGDADGARSRRIEHDGDRQLPKRRQEDEEERR